MKDKQVLLGVSGGIAAYKAADLTSQLRKRGAEVFVVMTEGAAKFITPLTLQTLSKNPVTTSFFDEKETWRPGHIDLADRANLLVIAPAATRDVHVKGKDDPIASTWVRTGSVGESTEGSIVRSVGVITEGPIDDEPFGHKFFIDDGSGPITVYVNNGAHTDVSDLAVGQLVSVTGFSTEFKDATTDHYEIDLRSSADLEQPVK